MVQVKSESFLPVFFFDPQQAARSVRWEVHVGVKNHGNVDLFYKKDDLISSSAIDLMY
jgi:hypothetical protein